MEKILVARVRLLSNFFLLEFEFNSLFPSPSLSLMFFSKNDMSLFNPKAVGGNASGIACTGTRKATIQRHHQRPPRHFWIWFSSSKQLQTISLSLSSFVPTHHTILLHFFIDFFIIYRRTFYILNPTTTPQWAFILYFLSTLDVALSLSLSFLLPSFALSIKE